MESIIKYLSNGDNIRKCLNQFDLKQRSHFISLLQTETENLADRILLESLQIGDLWNTRETSCSSNENRTLVVAGYDDREKYLNFSYYLLITGEDLCVRHNNDLHVQFGLKTVVDILSSKLQKNMFSKHASIEGQIMICLNV